MNEKFKCEEYEPKSVTLSEEEESHFEQLYEKCEEYEENMSSKPFELLDFIEKTISEYPKFGLEYSLPLLNIISLTEISILEHNDENLYEKFINVIISYREKFTDFYLNNAPYFDEFIINYFLSKRKFSELPKYLDYLKKYPIHSADILYESFNKFAFFGRTDLIKFILEDTYEYIFYSKDLISPGKFVSPLMDIVISRHFSTKWTDETINSLVEELKLYSKNIPEMEIKTSKEFWIEFFEDKFNKPFIKSIPENKDKESFIEFYTSISQQFEEFLNNKFNNKYQAFFYTNLLRGYLRESINKKKKFKKKFKFNFETNSIENFLYRYYAEPFFGVSFSVYMTMLYTIYHFAEFLLDKDIIDEKEKVLIQNNCKKLFEKIQNKFRNETYSLKLYDGLFSEDFSFKEAE